jgi:hypothetical protein
MLDAGGSAAPARSTTSTSPRQERSSHPGGYSRRAGCRRDRQPIIEMPAALDKWNPDHYGDSPSHHVAATTSRTGRSRVREEMEGPARRVHLPTKSRDGYHVQQ